VSLTWTAPSTGSASSYTVQYRPTGSLSWTGSSPGITSCSFNILGLNAGQNYDLQVIAIGSGATTASSSIVTVQTLIAGGAVSAVIWNIVPSGPFGRGVGVLAMNAHVSPGTAAVQFGLSNSAVVKPLSWTAGSFVNTDLWGAYVPVPSMAGLWYAWVEGLDGSASTASPTSIAIT
jgi:hypothetical protein